MNPSRLSNVRIAHHPVAFRHTITCFAVVAVGLERIVFERLAGDEG